MEKKINWCLKQKQRISLIEPNNNLMEAYFIKAENSLKAVRNEKNNPEWEITASYYTMYFSIYALLMKVGIKSEIHSCTIEFISQFFKKYFDNEDIVLLDLGRELREKIQYYLPSINELEKSRLVVNKVLDFHLKCKKISKKLDNESIKNIRNKIH